MSSQFSNKKFGHLQLNIQSLSQLSRFPLKLLPWFTSLTAFSKTQLLGLLIKSFECRAINTSKFLSIIDARYICCFVTCYKTQVEFCLAIINSICYYCRFSIEPSSLAIILRFDLVIMAAINNYVINFACFDHSDQKIDGYCFCFLYDHLIK